MRWPWAQRSGKNAPSQPFCRDRKTAWSAGRNAQDGRPMHQPTGNDPRKLAQTGLALGALGVVFGDIGTSPLYALRESIRHLPADERTVGVLGILSLIFWSLLIVVSWKYL